jgi:hypothetical protein
MVERKTELGKVNGRLTIIAAETSGNTGRVAQLNH